MTSSGLWVGSIFHHSGSGSFSDDYPQQWMLSNSTHSSSRLPVPPSYVTMAIPDAKSSARTPSSGVMKPKPFSLTYFFNLPSGMAAPGLIDHERSGDRYLLIRIIALWTKQLLSGRSYRGYWWFAMRRYQELQLLPARTPYVALPCLKTDFGCQNHSHDYQKVSNLSHATL